MARSITRPPKPKRFPRSDDPTFDLGAYWEQLSKKQRALIAPHLTPEDVAVIQRGRSKAARAGWRATPLTLGVKLGLVDDLPHSRFLANKFVDAVTGKDPFQIWNLPPQHGKSLIGSRLGPAWAYDLDPTIKLALTSYGDTLADENAGFVRDLLVEHPEVFDVRLRRDARRRDRFITTQGGGLIAAGVGSGLTGFGAHGVVVDDPFKNWEDAHSEAKRERVWNWYRSVVLSRLNHRRGIPPFVIIVQTRWHEDDLTGKALTDMEAGTGYKFTLVRMPAIAKAPTPNATNVWDRLPDPLGRAPGEPLAPTLHDVEDLEGKMAASGSYLAAGLYQQEPAPEEGTDIMRSWWKYSDTIPTAFDDALCSWDMKLKDKESGDFVVGQAWGRTGSDYWCIDSMRGQWNQATVRAAIALMSVRHPQIRRHVIENTGNGPEVMTAMRAADPGYVLSAEIIGKLGILEAEIPLVEQVMHRGLGGIIPENPKGDKRARMRAYTPLIEGGHVHVPENAPWVPSLIDESAFFPEGKHDDQIDAMSQALKRLSVGPARARGSRGQTKKPPVSKRNKGSATSGRLLRGATTRTKFRGR